MTTKEKNITIEEWQRFDYQFHQSILEEFGDEIDMRYIFNALSKAVGRDKLISNFNRWQLDTINIEGEKI